MEYKKTGSGSKAFVLISGIGMTSVLPAIDSVGKMYKKLLDEYTLYLFDRAEVLPDGYSISDMASEIKAALDIENVKSCVVTGMSQGGMIAQEFAITNPSMVEKLIICSSCSAPTSVAIDTLNLWKTLASSYDVVGLNRSFADRVYTDTFRNLFATYLKEHEADGTKEQCDRFVKLIDSCSTFDVTARLNQIKCPVLVLGANEDKVVGKEGPLTTASLLSCEIYMYENYGHAVYDEAPDFVDRIVKFVRG